MNRVFAQMPATTALSVLLPLGASAAGTADAVRTHVRACRLNHTVGCLCKGGAGGIEAGGNRPVVRM